MDRHPIGMNELNLHPIRSWSDWFLLASGDYAAGKHNSMTVSWGTMGHIWGMDVVQVVVRPQRLTREYMEECDTFTLSAFGPEYHGTLSVLGSKSGREMDKINGSGLTPAASTIVASPAWAEAELVLECRKVALGDFSFDSFIDKSMDRNYPTGDYHRFYFGEILHVSGTDKYRL